MADYSTVSLMTHEKNLEQETHKGTSPVCLSRFRVAYVLWKVSQLVLCQIWSVVLGVGVKRRMEFSYCGIVESVFSEL